MTDKSGGAAFPQKKAPKWTPKKRHWPNRHLWRLELAASMIRHGWSVGMARYVLRGGYDDPYYDSNPDDPVRARDVLAEEVSCQ